MSTVPPPRRIDPRYVGWGAFFIGLGLLPLAVALGATMPFSAGDLWQYWPVILILIGAGLIFRWTPYGALGSLVIGLAVGLLVGGLLTGTGASPVACGIGNAAAQGADRSGSLTSPTARVELDVACGDLAVLTQPGQGWSLTGVATPGGALSSDPTSLQVSLPASRSDTRDQPPLTATLPADPQLDLTVTQRFGGLTVNLGGAHIRGLQVSTDFSDSHIDLSSSNMQGQFDFRSSFGSADLSMPAGPIRGSARSDFGSLTVCLPASVPAQVTANSSFGSVSVSGLNQSGDVWQSSDYASATDRITLDVRADFGSVSVTRGGC
jgi:hypothetical protein